MTENVTAKMCVKHAPINQVIICCCNNMIYHMRISVLYAWSFIRDLPSRFESLVIL